VTGPAADVRPYEFDASLSERFVRLRADLYADDPHAPALDPRRLLRSFAPSFSFYGQPGNRHCHFAALDGERVIGHLSAFVKHDLADTDGTPVGTLGLFECVQDEAVARALVDAGLAWLAHVGRDARVWAPVDFDIWHGYRFRTRGFTSHSFPGEPYNKRWYPGFFRRHDFEVRERWESIEVAGAETLRRLAEPCVQRYHERLADGYAFASVDATSDAVTSGLGTLHRLVMNSFAGFLGFTPLTFVEFEELYGSLWRSIDLRLAGFVLDPEGEPVGFELVYPAGERVIFYMIGITREELAKRHGLGRAAFADVMRRIAAAGHERIVFALMSRESYARSGLHSVEDRAQTEHALLAWRAR